MIGSSLFYWIMLAGVALCAITGALEAGRKSMDIVGACAIGLATAIGGGTVRDLLIGRPVFWVSDQTHLIAALIATLIAFFLARAIRLPPRLFLIPDALGLALFTVSGTQTALNLGVPWLVAGFMGVITGVFGGVLRDIFCNEVPLVFMPSELYAITACAGAGVVVAMHAYGCGDASAAAAGFVTVAGFRLAALAFRLRTQEWGPRE